MIQNAVMRPIKFLIVLIIFSSKLLAQNAEQDSATAYSNRHFRVSTKKNTPKVFIGMRNFLIHLSKIIEAIIIFTELP